jgi:hypothetical protein
MGLHGLLHAERLLPSSFNWFCASRLIINEASIICVGWSSWHIFGKTQSALRLDILACYTVSYVLKYLGGKPKEHLDQTVTSGKIRYICRSTIASNGISGNKLHTSLIHASDTLILLHAVQGLSSDMNRATPPQPYKNNCP